MNKLINILLLIGGILLVWIGGFMTGGSVEKEYLARHTYPNVGTVTEINEKDDSVTFTDAVGFEWSFYGVEDWEIGDTVVVTMYDCGTEDIRDDRIVNKKYSSF